MHVCPHRWRGAGRKQCGDTFIRLVISQLKGDLNAYMCTANAHHHHTIKIYCSLTAVTETFTSLLRCWLIPKSMVKQLHGTEFIIMIINAT